MTRLLNGHLTQQSVKYCENISNPHYMKSVNFISTGKSGTWPHQFHNHLSTKLSDSTPMSSVSLQSGWQTLQVWWIFSIYIDNLYFFGFLKLKINFLSSWYASKPRNLDETPTIFRQFLLHLLRQFRKVKLRHLNYALFA